MQFTIPHVGINSQDEAEARHRVEYLSAIFGLEQTSENATGIFVGTQFEIMKNSARGHFGHIALKFDNVAEAVNELRERGLHFQEDTFKYDEQGNIIFGYLQEEVFGFAIHLTDH